MNSGGKMKHGSDQFAQPWDEDEDKRALVYVQIIQVIEYLRIFSIVVCSIHQKTQYRSPTLEFVAPSVISSIIVI